MKVTKGDIILGSINGFHLPGRLWDAPKEFEETRPLAITWSGLKLGGPAQRRGGDQTVSDIGDD